MSQHHRAQKWSKHSPKLRKLIEPQLPLPCQRCGKPVMPGSRWHVGHRHAAEFGGVPTLANVGPEHEHCSTSAGGKRGAQITNARRRGRTQSAKGIRAW